MSGLFQCRETVDINEFVFKRHDIGLFGKVDQLIGIIPITHADMAGEIDCWPPGFAFESQTAQPGCKADKAVIFANCPPPTIAIRLLDEFSVL